MIERLDYAWRLGATALAFLIFGTCGVLLRVIYFPLLEVLVRDRHERVRLARLTVHAAFRFFAALMRTLGILRYRVTGVEKLNRPGLFILANHPTLLDVVLLVSLVPNANCVVKGSLARNPFTRGPVRATDYIVNDSGPGLVSDCISSLKAGDNLVMFPEGTRTTADCEVHLQRGAANVAVRGERDITPVTIRCVPLSLTKGAPWWKVPATRMEFTIEVQDDIVVGPLIAGAASDALAARRLTEYLQNYFSRENHLHAGA